MSPPPRWTSRAEQGADLLATASHDRGIATVIVAHDSASHRRADRNLHLVGGKLQVVMTTGTTDRAH